MQLSCLPVSFFDDIVQGRMSVYEWARIGRDVGLEAIDLSILFFSERTLEGAKELRRQVEQASMRVAMVTSYPDFTHPIEERRKQELEEKVRTAYLAAEVGASLLRVTDGQAHPQTSLKDGIRWAVEGLNRLANRTADAGVQLVYENHAKPGAWEYTDFSQDPEIFLQILEQLDPRIKVNFDTGNAFAYSQNPMELLERVLPRLGSVHASDTGEIGRLVHVLVGSGKVNFPAIFSRLQGAGWSGWVCIEEASYQGVEGVQKAVQYIRTTWNQGRL